MPRPPSYMTAAEAGDVLRISARAAVELCRSGALAAIKPGKQWLITEADLDAYMTAGSNRQREAVA